MTTNKTTYYNFDLVADTDKLKSAIKTKSNLNWTEVDSTLNTIVNSIPSNNNELTNGAGYQTASDVSTALENYLSTIYPIGSIYTSVSSTSPAILFGGTWERISGKFLLAATDDGNSGASQAAGNTGGSATVTLTTAEIPNHGHGHNITVKTPSLSHSITQPAFKTPSLSHSITQPAFKTPVLSHSYTNPSVTGGSSSGAITGGSHSHHANEIGVGQRYIDNNGNTGYAALRSTNRTHVYSLDDGYVDSSTHSHDLPSHSHTVSGGGVGDHSAAACSRTTDVAISDHSASACSRTTNVAISDHATSDCTVSGGVLNSTGGDGAHNNMPPYLSVYIWKRVA